MPNTLAHLGIGGAATRSVITAADLKWIYIGALIPDLPWITQRIGQTFFSNINLYDLRLYVVIQATLFLCLVLSLALATLSKEYLKTFAILSLGSLIHLLLDSLQIKWANGVHLLAPFNWDMLVLNLIWPESFPNYIITLFGLVYFIVMFKKGINSPLNLKFLNLKRWSIFVCILLLYFILPLFMIDMPREADSHYVKTISNINERPGKYFEIDRRPYRFENGNAIINIFGEDVILKNIELRTSEKISIKARFIDENTADVIDYHVHSVLFRDGSSYLGIALIIIFLSFSFYRNRYELNT